jgi:protein-tyrosine-phosphatase
MTQERSYVNHQKEMNRLLTQLYCLDNAVNICFVCADNNVLSPFAQHYLDVLCKEVGIDWAVSSSGINASPRKDIACLNAAKKLGIDLSQHNTENLSESSLKNDYNIFFTFNEEIKQIVDNNRVQTFDLSHFIPKGLGSYHEIRTPNSDKQQPFDKCYLLIAEALKHIFEQYRALQ